MNQVNIMGRLTAEPELRYTPNQVPICTFGIAVQRRKQKDKEPITDFFTIISWRTKADFVAKHLRKGQRIVLTGELQTRNYTDKNGIKRWVTEIEAHDIHFADGNQNANSAPTQGNQTGADYPHNNEEYPFDA